MLQTPQPRNPAGWSVEGFNEVQLNSSTGERAMSTPRVPEPRWICPASRHLSGPAPPGTARHTAPVSCRGHRPGVLSRTPPRCPVEDAASASSREGQVCGAPRAQVRTPEQPASPCLLPVPLDSRIRRSDSLFRGQRLAFVPTTLDSRFRGNDVLSLSPARRRGSRLRGNNPGFPLPLRDAKRDPRECCLICSSPPRKRGPRASIPLPGFPPSRE